MALLTLQQSESTAARRRVTFTLLTSGGAEVTGATFAAADIQVSKNGAAFANSAGAVTEVGNGMYYYSAAQAELDTLGVLYLRIDDTTNPIVRVELQVVAYDPYEEHLDIWGAALEGTLTSQQLFKLIASALLGELSGAATTNVIIKAADDNATTRVDATVDADGNRIAVTLTP